MFNAENYAEDQVTKMHDDVKIGWEQTDSGLALIGSVVVDGKGVRGKTSIRNKIFYNEMPTALQALRHADRFLFDNNPMIDRALLLIHFILNVDNCHGSLAILHMTRFTILER